MSLFHVKGYNCAFGIGSQTAFRSVSRYYSTLSFYLGAEALRNFIELNEREICEVEQALIEADNSEFATENNINSILDKWSANSD